MKYTFSVASSTGDLPAGTLVATRDNVMAILGRGSNPATEGPRGMPTDMVGKVVNASSNYVRVDFPAETNVRIYHDRVYILTAVGNRAITKTIKWHGETLGALKEFIEQLEAEGADDNTKFLGDEHLHIMVELPLATKPKPDVEF